MATKVQIQECGHDFLFKQEPRVTVVLSFWHCALISTFLGKGKEKASIIWYHIVTYRVIYHANTQYRIISCWYHPPLQFDKQLVKCLINT